MILHIFSGTASSSSAVRADSLETEASACRCFVAWLSPVSGQVHSRFYSSDQSAPEYRVVIIGLVLTRFSLLPVR
jgi:hypothetical protein